MNYTLIVEPEAEAEIDEASRWYDEQWQGLGAEFLRAVEIVLSAVRTNPFNIKSYMARCAEPG